MDKPESRPELERLTLDEVANSLRTPLPHAEVAGLAGSAGARLVADLLAGGEPMVTILAPDLAEAQRFASALSFYHGRPGEVLLIPHWEVRPYEPLSPHPEVEGARLSALHTLLAGRARAVVVTPASLLQRVIPRAELQGLTELIRTRRDYDRRWLLERLTALGYPNVPMVEDRGTFSARGDIVDIFPPTEAEPVRLEFFGDELERMRPFDPRTQRSGDQELRELLLLPAREMVLAGKCLERFTRGLKERCDDLGIPRLRREAILEEVREGLIAPGRSFLLPLAYGGLETLFDYLPAGRWVFLDPPAVEQAADAFAASVAEGEESAARRTEPFLPAESLYVPPSEFERQMGLHPRIDFVSLHLYRMEEDRQLLRVDSEGNGDLRAEGGALARFASRLSEWQREKWRVLLVCHQKGQAERLIDLLEPSGVRLRFDPQASPSDPGAGEILLVLGDLPVGCRLPGDRLAVVTEEEVFGQRVRRRGLAAARAKAVLSSLAQLRERDFIVHADHGIGRYHGLVHLRMERMEGDFLHLEYAGGDKLYLPIDRIEKVQKYQGGEGHTPRLDKMGGSAWEKAKLRARAVVEELARELLAIYARRELSEGFAFSPPDRAFREFEASFPYEETPDQQGAIDDVLADMESGRPMDRLICGDVGYGKTEVAIRAAFKAVLDGKQVAVLVPTTILAKQHWQTFRERLQDHAVEVEMVSRFRSARETKEALERTAQGKVDILIGTHRLLQRDVRFKDLGLVIVDEEQRFGVAHKERLKKMRAEVAMLTLSATPIPRTLHMSLTGLRNLSVIDTPPVDRLAIRTYVTKFDDDLIRQAILRELQRGGQVFFVHNRVQSIGAMGEFLQKLVPEAKIAVGHGQMGEKALEEVMLDFVEGRSNVLVSTTIIENGLDIPRANTIIVNRADCFGLSQLYQLRGRVGRSRNRAYSYLLIPGEGNLTREARERLRVLTELTELGAGFRVASHDLELRGAGDMLGPNQAGQIAAIGFEMYADLLEETIQELKGQSQEDRVDPEIRLGLSAFLPEKYLPDPNQRLVFYKRLAAAPDEESVYGVADELRDRYGEIPPPGLLLLEVMKLRVVMKRLRVELAEYDGRQLVFGFHASTPVSPQAILELMERPGGRYRFTPDYRLSIALGKVPSESLPGVAKKELQGFL